MKKIIEGIDKVEYKIFNIQKKIDILLFENYSNHLKEFTKGYIWNKEEINLKLNEDGNITGSTKYGENIEDEWYIVSAFYSLTKSFEDLIVQIYDIDGEFLLIEAANKIPEWLTPENSSNRVFIHQGHLHIIPKIPQNPSEIGIIPFRDLSIEDSINIFKNKVDTKASNDINACILLRMKEKPFHHMKCYLPKKIANLLKKDKRWISKSFHSFYYRTPDDLNFCLKMSEFKGNEGYVMTRVCMTRFQYAILRNQEFKFPKCFSKLPPTFHKDYDAYVMGFKIACGFEIHYQQNKNEYPTFENEFDEKELPDDDSVEWLKAYEKMNQKLKKNVNTESVVNKMKDLLSFESGFDGIDPSDLEKIKDLENDDLSELKKYMDAMDKELNQYDIRDQDIDDVEMMKNFLESLKSEGGFGGPVSTLLGLEEDEEDLYNK